MARKNLFEPSGVTEGGSQPDLQAARRPAIMRGPVGALGNDLLRNSQREIDPDLIEDDSPSDRLTVEDDDLESLREQIRTHGQIVPILVRQSPERPGRYQIVYGRRRLAAIRGIPGARIKALIRNLSDDEAMIALSQENNARRDPSFIEKALFAMRLRDMGVDTQVIADALVTDATTLSRMKRVTGVIPVELIGAIGSAPGAGRRRWKELAELASTVPPGSIIQSCRIDTWDKSLDSDGRLATAIAALRVATEAPGANAKHASDEQETSPGA